MDDAQHILVSPGAGSGKASELWARFLEDRSEGAFEEWFDANRAAGEEHREAR